MSCEKASKRLRILIAKAKRLGISQEEVADLPTAKKLTTVRVTSFTWSILAAIGIIILGGSLFLIYLCNPCNGRRIVQDVRTDP